MVAIARGTAGGGARPAKSVEVVGMESARSIATVLVVHGFAIFGNGNGSGRGAG